MKATRATWVTVVTFLICLCFTSQARAGRVYLLLAADTSERGKIALSTGPDLQFMHDVFYANVPGRQLVVYGSEIYDEMTDDGPQTHDVENPWKGPDIRDDLNNMKENLLTAIRNCPAGPEDTVIFFYSGHGAYDSNGHYLVMPDGKNTLPRQSIIREIQKKQPRLIVLITDSCNTLVPRAPVPLPIMRLVPPAQIAPLFDSLFVQPKGVLDVNSSTEDEVAAGPVGGGLLVLSMAYLGNKPTFGRDKPDGRAPVLAAVPRGDSLRPVDFDRIISEQFGMMEHGLGANFDPEAPSYGYLWEGARNPGSWDELKTAVTRKMDTLFRELYPNGKEVNGKIQRTQTPRFYSMPESGPAPPARILGLTRGDVLLSVNGRPIRNLQDAIQAIGASGETMEFTVRDSRDGTVWRMQTQLRRQSSRFGAYLADNPGGGAIVTGVMRGYPCTKNQVLGKVTTQGDSPVGAGTGGTATWSPPQYRPEAGDHITEVNERQIRTTSEFYDAVKSSPTEMTFRMVDHRTGRTHLLRTQLNPATARSRLGIGVRDDAASGVRIEYVRDGYPGARCQLAL